MRALATLAALMLTALPAGAGTFTPPQGCEGYLTVQSRGCKVSHHYRCAADAAGDQWRADFGVNGLYFISRIDYEAQWVESHESNGSVDLLEPGAADPASFSELLSTGQDSYDFATMKNTGERENVRGYDKLTGESVVIDGVTLKRTKYEVRATRDDGSLVYAAKGNEYIHPEWRIFISGAGTVDLGDGPLPQDFSPVEFAFPGDPGFMTTTPLYECDAMTASFQVAPNQETRDEIR